MSDRSRKRVFISGTVQGVFFRASTQELARQLAVDGWVRNLDDGRVEAVFEGEPEAVDEVVEWCHDGPERARVTDVSVSAETPKGINGFSIRR